MRTLRAAAKWLAVLAPLTMLACRTEFSQPTYESQVIEELTFSPTLGIDLDAMVRTPTGVYLQDLTVGEGDPVVAGDRVRVYYEGYLASGLTFDVQEYTFTLGIGAVIAGFEEGMMGMQAGGLRRMIIPPALGFGNQPTENIPAGSVLVFEVELLEIVG